MRSTTIRLLASAAFFAAVGLPTACYAIQCAIYARAQTGVRLYGDAGAWWGEAAGRYLRGQEPTRGAILVFQPSSYIRHGHVAVVSRVVGRREILVDQANWVRGRVNHDTSVIDTSPGNDWTSVRVADLGSGTHGRVNPTFGFVYPSGAAPVIEVARNDTGRTSVATRGSAVAMAAYRHPAPIARATVRLAAIRGGRHHAGAESAVHLAAARGHARLHEHLAAERTRHPATRVRVAAATPSRRHSDRVVHSTNLHLHLAAAGAHDRVRLHIATATAAHRTLHVAMTATPLPTAKPSAPQVHHTRGHARVAPDRVSDHRAHRTGAMGVF